MHPHSCLDRLAKPGIVGKRCEDMICITLVHCVMSPDEVTACLLWAPYLEFSW